MAVVAARVVAVLAANPHQAPFRFLMVVLVHLIKEGLAVEAQTALARLRKQVLAVVAEEPEA